MLQFSRQTNVALYRKTYKRRGGKDSRVIFLGTRWSNGYFPFFSLLLNLMTLLQPLKASDGKTVQNEMGWIYKKSVVAYFKVGRS
jgi:hypothetical protein